MSDRTVQVTVRERFFCNARGATNYHDEGKLVNKHHTYDTYDDALAFGLDQVRLGHATTFRIEKFYEVVDV